METSGGNVGRHGSLLCVPACVKRRESTGTKTSRRQHVPDKERSAGAACAIASGGLWPGLVPLRENHLGGTRLLNELGARGSERDDHPRSWPRPAPDCREPGRDWTTETFLPGGKPLCTCEVAIGQNRSNLFAFSQWHPRYTVWMLCSVRHFVWDAPNQRCLAIREESHVLVAMGCTGNSVARCRDAC